MAEENRHHPVTVLTVIETAAANEELIDVRLAAPQEVGSRAPSADGLGSAARETS
jgi:hypothetical protein